MQPTKALIIGASGQIGTVLTEALIATLGAANVVASDVRPPAALPHCHFEILDILNAEKLQQLIANQGITDIYHLAAILSAKGEASPIYTWQFNMNSLFNVLEAAKAMPHAKVFFPSTIAVFGNHIDKKRTGQFAPLYPTTVYGMSKVAGENWCQYYFEKYGVDVRSVRYPGIIGYQSLPGGGTTDYAVDIFHKAVKGDVFSCFLAADTVLPMMYMDDAIRATLEIMAAPKEAIQLRTSYNIAGVSFAPNELYTEIKRYVPAFEIAYAPDFRQQIAASWPQVIDDTPARAHWGWQSQYDLSAMTTDMLHHLKQAVSN